jgi:hypothetical protein
MTGLGGQRSRRVRHLGTTWRQTASAYAVRLLPSTQVVRLVGVPLNKNTMELKTPKQEARERYLPLKAGRLTSAEATPQEEPSHVGDFKRLLTWDGPAMGQLCVHRCTCGTCVCAGETRDTSQRHVHSTIRSVSHGVTQRESLGDSTPSRRWGFP